MRIIQGVITNGVTLASGDSPVLIGGVVTNDGTGVTVGLYGGTGIYGDIRNFGTVGDTGGTYYGIKLRGDGTVTNGSPLAADALIAGSYDGLRLFGNGTVSNFGTIAGGHIGAVVEQGRLTNNSTGLISGGYAEGVFFAATSTVVNYGSIKGAEGVYLSGGGRVTNGTSAITRSTISGSRNGVRFHLQIGVATLSNFGTITSTASYGSAVLSNLDTDTASLRIINGAAASNAALISGVT
ncbi:MAG TPA: hypothetical protein VFQ82_11215, partial [Stellaceae bacterium]|nr:hypothetical protein [Stellaceae bacterium]